MARDRRLDKPSYLENLGDCEIRSIGFETRDAHLLIADPYNKRQYAISFFDASQVLLRSNHMQNVIEDMKIFPDLKAARCEVAIANLFKEADLDDDDENKLVFYFEPLAGGELLFICKEWSSRIAEFSPL